MLKEVNFQCSLLRTCNFAKGSFSITISQGLSLGAKLYKVRTSTVRLSYKVS